ncbi:hypothetical protein K0C01_12260 [Salinarchaeum sp. IM2453]|uniref:hypothetical protein n=1 Tax=Salinarchaeum sp. IM2453 TaxID=2862870 RepID=UPI001C828844|nr:hypothetical protein [Salinarchaeum sp. IM2453]QZA88535.1 hypothetical protein K0C01_12260 [Salinarchaeum sp. IM2453]
MFLTDRLPSFKQALTAMPVIIAVLVFLYRGIGPHMWRVRLHAAQFFSRFPQQYVPIPAKVLPPPESEFVGVWDEPPEIVRQQLTEDYAFKQLFRAYLHAYNRQENMTYEVASCAYRPNGITGQWQLHVRLFPTGDGRTDVWAHWELNPNVAPLSHLRREGYDPDRGEQKLRELLDDHVWDRDTWEPA